MTPASRPIISTRRQLRQAIDRLSPASPITDHFSAQWRKLGNQGRQQQEQKVVWYQTQNEHWLGWLDAYNGPGGYNRKNADRSAEFVYNHVVNPQMLVYLAEAINIDRILFDEATKSALSRHGSMSSMSAAIRRIIPWPIVEEALGVSLKLQKPPTPNIANNSGPTPPTP